MGHIQREVLMLFLLRQQYIDLNHIGLNMVNNFLVILTLCMQLINVTIVTRGIEKEIYKFPTKRTMQSNSRSQYIWQTHFICEENRWICI